MQHLLQLVGRAVNQGSISTWIDALGRIEGLGSPWVESVSSRDGGDATFTITAELNDDKDDDDKGDDSKADDDGEERR